MQKGEESKLKLQAEALSKLTTKDFKYHKMSVQEVLSSLKTEPVNGLNDQEAEKRLKEYGPNELADEEEESIWEKIKESFEDLLARILLLAAFISFVIALFDDKDGGIGAYVEPFVILLILVLNAIVAIYQDMDAESALDALKSMSASECFVLRHGKWNTSKSEDLVPGDIVKVKIGDCVPADLRIVQMESVSLMVEEAPLTGESCSVHKSIDAMQNTDSDILQSQRNMLFSSTVINYGTAIGVVVFTGTKTAIGRVQQQVKEAAEEEEDTPLKQKLDKFGEQLANLIGIVCLLVWIMNYKNFWDEIHGTPIMGCIHYFKIAIALAVAAIPEGLPAVITTCLALGTRKMAKNNAIVRRLPSVETLGCTSVICTDKTGTLTKNQMSALQFAVIEDNSASLKEYKVQENKNSYDPRGSVQGTYASDRANSSKLFDSLATGCAINNRAEIRLEGGQYTRVGEPTEAALQVLAEKMDTGSQGTSYSERRGKEVGRLATLDFTSERKAMSTVVTNYKNGKDLLIKGAPDRVIAKCGGFLSLSSPDTPVEFTAESRQRVLDQIAHYGSQGLRCLALAEVPHGGQLASLDENNKAQYLGDIHKYAEYESGAVLVGVVCLKDTIREEVPSAIAACKLAGIRVVMITGDSQETATAIAQEVGILEQGQSRQTSVFTGEQFAKMTASERQTAISGDDGMVFSRVEPAHKRELVKCLIDAGQIVAMTGDGVNDAPALKQAHIGIAMGISGTEVAKFASDMVLADDNFATIVKAIEEGRAIYSNMKAFIRYLISSNIGEVLSIFFTAMLGVPEGFSSVQLLWVNLVTDGPPATALGFNPPDSDNMRKPPRPHDENLLNRWTIIRYSVIGFYVGCATVGIFVYWYIYADWTGDGHTLVSWYQLSHWGECPAWKDFHPAPFSGLDFSQNPCAYFTAGKVKASTLSLSVLVLIEMLNALNAISEDNSLLESGVFLNPYLLLAIAASMILHCVILYIPIFAQIFGILPMNLAEWGLVLAFSSPVIILDEVLKVFGRAFNKAELDARLARKKRH